MKIILRSEKFPIFALLFLCLVTGLLTLTNFGESWDELQFYKYADHALASYGTWLQGAQIVLTGNTYDNYGPAFVMFTALVAGGLHAINPGWLVSDLRHLVYFLTFLAGIYAFYALARRWMSNWAAMAGTLLFAAQPVFWGHAFISPKDIPFLSAFLISLLLGLHMVDTQPALPGAPRRGLMWIIGIWILSLLFLFFTPQILDNGVTAILRDASTRPQSFLGSGLRSLSSSFGRADVEIYIQRALVLLIWLKLVYLCISAILMGWLVHRWYPAGFQLLNPGILTAGLALGLTTSIRILGPLAGLLVVIYAWQKKGRQILPALAVYAGLAMAAMLITWPYLWPNPPGRLVESLRVMSEYPWKGQVFFNGGYYASNDLPRAYLPVLLAIQLTEPIWPLFVLGLALLWKNKFLLMAGALWFALPLVALIVTRSPLYDNFRQVIFILPPVFFIGGLSLDWLFTRLTRPLVRGAITAALVLPGILAGLQLHPYEYIYYNSFIGGVPGAQGRFELDYWATSYRAAMQYVNGIAPANAKIFVAGPSYLASLYARPDLKIYGDADMHSQSFDYAILTTRYRVDLEDFPNAPVIETIERDGQALSVIKKLDQ